MTSWYNGKQLQSKFMPDPDALWKDIQRLDDLYEELLWDPDDELQFTHDGEKIIITNKTRNNGKLQLFNNRGGNGLTSLMTGLNEIALSLWVGLDYFFFPLLISQLVAGLLARRLLQAGTPTDSQVVILRVLISLQRLCQRLLMLWVILFFYFGVLSLREISSAEACLGDSGLLWRSTVPSP